jgi:hypothetical protein
VPLLVVTSNEVLPNGSITASRITTGTLALPVQLITLRSSTPLSAGSFTLSYNGLATAPLPYTSTGSQLAAAVSMLAGAGYVTAVHTDVSTTFEAREWRVTFWGAERSDPVLLLPQWTGAGAPPGACTACTAFDAAWSSVSAALHGPRVSAEYSTAGTAPVGGSFALQFMRGSTVLASTGSIPVQATAATVRAALQSVSSVLTCDVTVTRGDTSAQGQVTWTVTFALQDSGSLPDMVCDSSSVTGTGVAVRVQTVAHGQALLSGSFALAVPVAVTAAAADFAAMAASDASAVAVTTSSISADATADDVTAALTTALATAGWPDAVIESVTSSSDTTAASNVVTWTVVIPGTGPRSLQLQQSSLRGSGAHVTVTSAPWLPNNTVAAAVHVLALSAPLSTSTAEQQQLTVTNAQAGYFGLSLDSTVITTAVPWNATEAQLLAALTAADVAVTSVQARTVTATTVNWQIVFDTAAGPVPLLQATACLQSPVAEAACSLVSLNGVTQPVVSVKRLVLGTAPAYGTFKLALQSTATDSTAAANREVTAALPAAATAAQLTAALQATQLGAGAEVTRVPHPAAGMYGFLWRVTLPNSAANTVQLSIIDSSVRGPVAMCSTVTGSVCAFPAVLPFTGSSAAAAAQTVWSCEESGGWCPSVLPGANVSARCTPCDAPLAAVPQLVISTLKSSATLTGSVAAVRAGLQSLVYAPAQHWNAAADGIDVVSAVLGTGSSSGSAVELLLHVNAVNDAPSISASAQFPGTAVVSSAAVSNSSNATVDSTRAVFRGTVIEGVELALAGLTVHDPDIDAVSGTDTPLQVTIAAQFGTVELADARGLVIVGSSSSKKTSSSSSSSSAAAVAVAQSGASSGWQSKLTVRGSQTRINAALQQLYYSPPQGQRMAAAAALASTIATAGGQPPPPIAEVQQLQLRTVLAPRQQLHSVSTSTARGYIGGTYTLQLDCKPFVAGLAAVAGATGAAVLEAAFSNSAVTGVLAGDAPAATVETAVDTALQHCAAAAAAYVAQLATLTGTALPDSALYTAPSATVQRSSDPDYHGGYTWQLLLDGVPPGLLFTVGTNSLNSVGTPLIAQPTDPAAATTTPAISVQRIAGGSTVQPLDAVTGSWYAEFAGAQTAALSPAATAAELQAALQALPTVGAVHVSSASDGRQRFWRVTFLSNGFPAHAGDVPALTVSTSELTGDDAALTVSEVVKGAAVNDVVIMSVNDLGSSGSGGALTAELQLQLAIAPRPPPPTVLLPPQVDAALVVSGGATLLLRGVSVTAAATATSQLLTVKLTASRGSLALASTEQQLQELEVEQSTGASLSVYGTVASINAALEQLQYVAPGDYSGWADVTVTASTTASVAEFDADGSDARSSSSSSSSSSSAAAMHILIKGVLTPPQLSGPKTLTVTTSDAPTPLLGLGLLKSARSLQAAGALLTITATASSGTVAASSATQAAAARYTVSDDGRTLSLLCSVDAASAALGGLSYTPTAGDSSGSCADSDSVEITVQDAGGISASHTIELVLAAAALPPVVDVASLPLLLSVAEDSTLAFARGIAIRSSSRSSSGGDDSSGAVLTVEVYASHGTFALSDAPAASITAGTASSATATDGLQFVPKLSLSGTRAHVEFALSGSVYKPDADYWGYDEIVVLARRGRYVSGSSSGASSAVLAVFVAPVNDAPTITLPQQLSSTAVSGVSMSVPITIDDADGSDSLLTIALTCPDVATGGTLSLQEAAAASTTALALHFVTAGGSTDGYYAALNFTATLADAQFALARLRYRPGSPGQGGVHIAVTDSDYQSSSGTAQTVNATLQLTIVAGALQPPSWRLPLNGYATVQQGSSATATAFGLSAGSWERRVTSGRNLQNSTLAAAAAAAPWVSASIAALYGDVLPLLQSTVVAPDTTNTNSSSSSSIGFSSTMGSVDVSPLSTGGLLFTGAAAAVSDSIAALWLYRPHAGFTGTDILTLTASDVAGTWHTEAVLPVHVQPDVTAVLTPSISAVTQELTARTSVPLSITGLQLEAGIDSSSTTAARLLTLRVQAVTAAGEADDSVLVSMQPDQPGVWVQNTTAASAATPVAATAATAATSVAAELVAHGTLQALQSAVTRGALQVTRHSRPGTFNLVAALYYADSSSSSSAAVAVLTELLLPSQTVQLSVTVEGTPAPATAVCTGALFYDMLEGAAVELAGLAVVPPVAAVGYNAAQAAVTVALTATGGLINFPELQADAVEVSGAGTADVQLTGTLAAVNAAVSKVLFQGTQYYNGGATVAMTIGDDRVDSSNSSSSSSAVTIAIAVAAVNDAPVLHLPATAVLTIAEDTPLYYLEGLYVTDPDADETVGGAVTLNLTASTGTWSGAYFNANSNSSSSSSSSSSNSGNSSVTLRGTVDEVNLVLESLIYTPQQDFSGAVTLNVSCSDGGNTGRGGVLTATDSFTIRVKPVNDAPLVTLAAEYSAVQRAGECVVAVTNFTVTDVDSTATELYTVAISTQFGELLLPIVPAEATVTRRNTVTDATTTAAASSFTVELKGTLAAVQAALASAVYSCSTAGSSTAYAAVADTLSITAIDGHGAVSAAVWAPVIITAELQPPRFELLRSDAPLQVLEDEPLLIGALLELALSSADDSALLTVTAAAERGSLSTSSATSSVTGNASESNGQVVLRGGLAAVNAALAELTYTGASNAHGRDTITLTASSSSGSSGSGDVAATAVPLTLAVVVAPVNDAPVVLPPLEVKLSADSTGAVITGLSVIDVDVTDEQYDSVIVTVTLSSDRGSIVLKRSDGLQFTEGKTIVCHM